MQKMRPVSSAVLKNPNAVAASRALKPVEVHRPKKAYMNMAVATTTLRSAKLHRPNVVDMVVLGVGLKKVAFPYPRPPRSWPKAVVSIIRRQSLPALAQAAMAQTPTIGPLRMAVQ